MYIVEAFDPEGWVVKHQHPLEYWAIRDAQGRCCAEGIRYRIREARSNQITAVVDTSSCKALTKGGS